MKLHTPSIGLATRFNKSFLVTAIVLGFVGSLYTSLAMAQTAVPLKAPQIQPSQGQVSRVGEPDEYADLQKRIDKLKTANCKQQYARHKAQAWLNFSRELYHELAGSNGRKAALSEAENLVRAIEEGKPISLETKLIEDATDMRPNLRAAAQAKAAGLDESCCAALEVAFCEVQLVYAGFADAHLGGTYLTAPLLRRAEDICAESTVKQCKVAAK